jgi:hypothetical protein
MAFDGSPYGLSAEFTVDVGYKAFVVCAFMHLEAQHEMNSRSLLLQDDGRPTDKV